MAPRRLTADTSVVIPLLADWHRDHQGVRAACGDLRILPGHVELETIAGLTSMPGHAVSSASALRTLRSRFADPPCVLDSEGHRALADAVAAEGLRGGQVYDALIAATAREHGLLLLSRDRRAERTYRLLGADYELIG